MPKTDRIPIRGGTVIRTMSAGHPSVASADNIIMDPVRENISARYSKAANDFYTVPNPISLNIFKRGSKNFLKNNFL